VNNKNSVDNQIALIRSQVHSLIHQENANVPAERMVTVRSAFSVVKRSLNETRDLPFEVREYRALRELSAFITLAQQNKSITAFPKHTDLLPVSHPASTARHAMTASALNYARMQWSLAGTQISEEVRAIVASAVLATPGSIEQKYAITRLSSLPNISLEALLAALGDGNSRDSLSRRAMLQRRDRKGRFAYQGGGGSGLVRLPNGEVQRLTGKPVSQSADGNTIRMELPDGRLVDLPMGGMEFVRAVINPTKDGYSGVPATYDSSDEVVDQDSLQYFDAPHGFRADGDYTADPTDPNDSNGKKYTDDAYDVVVKDNGDYLVSRRGSDGAFAAVDSWSEAQKAIQVDEPSYANQQGMQPIARLSDEQIAKMYDDPDFDAFDIPNPLGEEAETKPKTKDGGEQPPQGPQKFAFTYPENAFKLSTDPTDFEPEGYQDQDSSNYTDDPKVLASKFKLEGLIGQLKKSILPKEDGSPATAYAPFPFNEGPELVPSEAIYAAIGEKGGDPQLEVAKIYDEALGGTANQDALEASRAKPVSEPIATLPDEAPTDEPNPGDIADAISSGDLTEEEIQAMLDGEAIGDADIEGDAPEEIKSKKAAKEVAGEDTVDDSDPYAEFNSVSPEVYAALKEKIKEAGPFGFGVQVGDFNFRDEDGYGITVFYDRDGDPEMVEQLGTIIGEKDLPKYSAYELAWDSDEMFDRFAGELREALDGYTGSSSEEPTSTPDQEIEAAQAPENQVDPASEKLPEIGGGWEPTRLPLIYDDGSKEYREVYVKELPNGDKLAFRKDSDNTYVIYSVDSNGNLESSPKGLTYLSWKDFQTDEASPEKFDQLSAFISQNRQNLVRARLSNKLATLGFDQSVVDLAKTGTPEEVKAAIEADPAYASLKQAHETYIQSTAINTSQANAKGAAAYNSINEEVGNLKPNLEVGSPEENAQAIESASIPEMNVAPKSSSVKVTVAASDLKEGDITFQEENPKYSGGVLKEPFTHYFVIEEVFTDENTPEGKVNVRGYYPGHQSQVRDWNKDTPISAIRGEFLVPLQGDKPGIERPKQSEEKYAKNEAGKLTPEGRAQWLEDIANYTTALKESAAKYSDPVTDYIDAPQAPENTVPEAPKKPWKAPDAPAFQGDKLVALVKEADGDPEKLKELLDNETVTYFDFETDANSFNADETQPVQIAAHKIKNGEIVDSFMMFMNPGTELGVGGFYYKGIYEGKGKDKKFIPELDENGNLIPSGVLNTPDGQPITNEWLATQPSREEIMAQFFEWMGADPILAGHNSASFDEPILRQQALDLGVEYGYTGLIDTLSIARSIDPGYGAGKHTLGTLTEKYGVELDNWHDASADSMAVKGILDAMLLDMKNNNVGMDQMDPDAKTKQYLKALEKYENDLQAFKDYERAQEVDSLVKDGLEGKDLPSIEEVIDQNTVSDPTPVEGFVNAPTGIENLVKDIPTPPLSNDSAEWVMDDNNTTLIEGKIRPDDFQVGDFIPSKLGGYHEVLDIEEDVDNPNQLKIKTRIVGTDKEYDKTWFRYNKNFDGVRRPNGVVDNITDDLSDAPLEYNISDWNFVKDLGGSNGAGLYEDKNGNQFVVKVPKSEKHAANEVLASEFYEEAGIKTGRVYKGKNIDGETVLVSPFLEGSQETFGSRFEEPEVLAEAQKGFAIDAWLNNYDSVGLEYDNMVMVGDAPVRVDPGGALLFRAQGKDKADQLTPEVTQIDSLRDSGVNSQAASVFGSMTDEQLADSAQLVANITPEKINELVDKHFSGDEETANFLKERLIARRENLVERFNLDKTVYSLKITGDKPKSAQWTHITKKSNANEIIKNGFAPREEAFGGSQWDIPGALFFAKSGELTSERFAGSFQDKYPGEDLGQVAIELDPNAKILEVDANYINGNSKYDDPDLAEAKAWADQKIQESLEKTDGKIGGSRLYLVPKWASESGKYDGVVVFTPKDGGEELIMFPKKKSSETPTTEFSTETRKPEPTTYEDAEQDQKDLGLQPAIATPKTVAPFKHDPDTILLDPTGDLETQIQDAIASGNKIAFYYNDKERLVTPKNMWTNPKYGHVNLRATDEMGVEKNYTLDKISMSFGESASDDLGVPTPPAKEVLPSEDLGVPQEPSDLDAGTVKAKDASLEQLGSSIVKAFYDTDLFEIEKTEVNTYEDAAGKTILEVFTDSDLGDFEITKNSSGGFNYSYGDPNGNTSSYSGKPDDSLESVINSMLEDVQSTDNFNKTNQESDLPIPAQEDSPIADIVSGIFDGTETEVPSVDEIVADMVADDPVKNPITDPNLIFESIKNQFPDNIELPNGDLVVRRKTVVKDGVSYNYDTVVRRNANETFSVYIRETNLSDNSSRVFGYKRAVHSDQALKNQINKITKSLDGSLDPQKWMKSKKAVPEVNLPDSPAGDPIQEIADDLSSPEFPKTEDTVVNALLDLVANSLIVDGTPDKALEALKNFPGISQETVDRVSQIVSDTLVKKPEVNQTDTPNTTDSPYVSADGKTPVKVGDKVFYAKDGKVGVVTALIKAQVTQAGGFGDYAYSDYVKVQFPGDKKPKTRNTKFLSIQNGEESSTPTPAPVSAPEPEAPKASQEDLNDVSSIGSYPSTGIEKAAVTPSITNPDVGVYINANNEQVNVPMTSYGDASFLNNRSPQSVLDTEVPVGALLVSTTSEGQTQVLVVTDNLQNIAGGKPGQGQITVVGRFEGGHSKMTIMTSSKNPKNLKVYLPNDGGNGDGDADIEPINPSDSPSTIEEVSDLVDSISTGIKNDPNLADKVNTDAMDSAVDSASEALNPASNPDFTPPTSAVDQAWVEENLKDYVPVYLLGNEDLKVGDIIKEAEYVGNGVNADIVVTSIPGKEGSYFKVIGTSVNSSNGELINPNSENNFWQDSVRDKKVLRHKTLAPADPFVATPPVTPEETKNTQKKSSKFINLKKVNAGELKVGDVVTRKVGKLQYQVLAIKPHPTKRNQYQVIYRTMASPNTGYKDGAIVSGTWHETGFGSSSSGYTTKRPKPEWFADALKAAGLPEKPKTSAPKFKQDGPVTSLEDLKTYGVDKTSKDFLDYFGADNYEQYKKAMSGFFVKDSSGKYLMPGMVVSDSEGNSGVVVDASGGAKNIDVTWVVGPKAFPGKETVDGSSVSSNATFISKETAKDLGVNISETVESIAKSNIEDIKEADAKAAALKAEEDKKKAEYAKMKKANTVSGSGASPVEVDEPLDWSESEYEEVPSLTAAMSLVKTDVPMAQNGIQVLVDSDSIEDNLVRVHRVKDADGQMKTRVRFKLTNWAANDKVEKILGGQDSATISGQVEIPKFSRTPEGLVKDDTWKMSAAFEGATYSIELPEGQGYALIHRSSKTAKTPTYTNHAHKSDELIAFNNEVDIYLPDNATPEQIQDALSRVGVQASRPATAEDIKVMAENKIIALFGKKGNGAQNYSGELRTKILEDAKEQYGVDASEITPEVINNGDVTFVMPQDVANKIAETINAKYFTHTWHGSFSSGGPEKDAEFLFNLITQGGIKSTVDRWTSGINVDGTSSFSDVKAAGGNYVFTHMGNSDSKTFVFDLMSMLRRLDFYANNSDKWGQKSENQSPIEELQTGAYEIMFKGTISWADLAKLNVNSATRAYLIELLTNAGVKSFGDNPIEAVIGNE
jgi:DNA polymerase III epsilon subunit-like protein